MEPREPAALHSVCHAITAAKAAAKSAAGVCMSLAFVTCDTYTYIQHPSTRTKQSHPLFLTPPQTNRSHPTATHHCVSACAPRELVALKPRHDAVGVWRTIWPRLRVARRNLELRHAVGELRRHWRRALVQTRGARHHRACSPGGGGWGGRARACVRVRACVYVCEKC